MGSGNSAKAVERILGVSTPVILLTSAKDVGSTIRRPLTPKRPLTPTLTGPNSVRLQDVGGLEQLAANERVAVIVKSPNGEIAVMPDQIDRLYQHLKAAALDDREFGRLGSHGVSPVCRSRHTGAVALGAVDRTKSYLRQPQSRPLAGQAA